MHPRHLPAINLRYWLGITLASVFGTNLGDFYAHATGLGILPGLAVLALICAAAFAAEQLDGGVREFYYWTVIIIIRTGATNIADYTAYRLHVPEPVLNAGLMLLLALLSLVQARSSRSSAATSPGARLPATGTLYWIAMLTAGVLGTVLGDVCEHAFGDGVAAISLSLLLMGVLFWRKGGIGPFYWLIIAVARTAGTAVGDWLAENRILNIGLPLATLATGLMFVAVLLLWSQRSDPLRPPPKSFTVS
jgi:uncharacterized membrane-anchored protein